MTVTTLKLAGAGAVALLAGYSLAGSLAMAQAPDMVRVRATIESVDGQNITAKSRDGAEMKIHLADNAPVNEVVKVALSDIKPNSYVAVTAMPQPDGSQKATAVIIFPEAMRGLGVVDCFYAEEGEGGAADGFGWVGGLGADALFEVKRVEEEAVRVDGGGEWGAADQGDGCSGASEHTAEVAADCACADDSDFGPGLCVCFWRG